MEKRGPKVGDSASLWNFALVPGWTHDEVSTLKLALQKFGIGRWKEICESGYLPGKLIQQLNGQTQRLLGQQSLAAFTGLHVDVDKVRADNIAKEGPEYVRKGGLLINTQGTMAKDALQRLRKENQEKYGYSQEEIDGVDLGDVSLREATTAMGVMPDRAASSVARGALQKRASRNPPSVQSLSQAARKRAEARIAAALVAVPNLAQVAMSELERPEKMVLMLHMRRQLLSLTASLEALGGAEENVKPTTNALTTSKVKKTTVGKGKKRAAPSEEDEADVAMAEAPPPPKRAGAASRGKAKGKGGAKTAAMDDDAEGLSAQVAQLMQMGFNRKKAQDALEENNGDLEASVEWLFAMAS